MIAEDATIVEWSGAAVCSGATVSTAPALGRGVSESPRDDRQTREQVRVWNGANQGHVV